MKRVCVFTAARSEYGLLKPLMEELKQDKNLELVLLVSGQHLSPEFGLTYQIIEEDGFRIDEKVEILLSTDTTNGVGKAMGLGMMGYTESLDRLKPDLIVVLGDRFETFSLAGAAVLKQIPIAHIHGGELTFGAWDDVFRHAITKMSLLHFTCAQEYRQRVIQMGENPERVFNVGSLVVEHILKTVLPSKKEFYEFLGFNIKDSFLLITFHPETLKGKKNKKYFQALLNALSDERFKTLKLIFTHSNSDSFGRLINMQIENYVESNPKRSVAFETMGQVNYLCAMKYASAIMGNSSSGIIEAPSFKVPVINIGDRQKGRIRADNIIDCTPLKSEIIKALEKGLSPSFKKGLSDMKNPFQIDSTALTIKDTLKNYDLRDKHKKGFFDITRKSVKDND